MNNRQRRLRRLGWPAIALAILACVALLRYTEQLTPLEHAAADLRARALARDISSDIVIVGIDARSLDELNEWPWPRELHAQLLDRLKEASAASVFLDISFSAYTTSTDDALLEAALARWHDPRVKLAAHFQPASSAGSDLLLTRPLERFARHAELAYVNLLPSRDGLVREARSSWRVQGETLRSLLAHDAQTADGVTLSIDYSIRPSSFGIVSYSDVLTGRVSPADLAGKTIYVGATALELRDVLPVPVHQTLPGVVVLALATETARAGPVQALPEWLYALLLALCTFASVRFCCRNGWRRNAALLGAMIAATTLAALYLYSAHRLDLEVSPFIVAAAAAFLVATLQSLDYETWRALAFAIGLRRRDALLRSIAESSKDSIVCVDAAGIVRDVNPAAAELFGRARSTLVGKPLGRLMPELAGMPIEAILRTLDGAGEHAVALEDGGTRPVEMTMSRVALRGEPLYTAILRDISERKAREQELEYQASHDPLTGLPNRAALMRRLQALLARCLAGQHGALLMLDLCRFKEVNDTLGHEAGDEVLCEVARRFERTLAGHAFIGRIGGDEFAVVAAGVGRLAVEALARQLAESLKTPVHARGIAIELGLSIGIASWPEHARDAQTLLRHADIAMYAAKRRNSMCEHYQKEDDRHTVRRLSMVSELRAAITADDLELHYQPQVDLRSGRTESVEALVRWQHPVLGQVAPLEFVTLAESTDLIGPLTDWTLRRALAQLLEWRNAGVELRVAVNLSARILQDLDLPARLEALFAGRSIAPEWLELEITESAMMSDPERAKRNLKHLHAFGVQIAIDDFGTGFSSLAYLRDLPVNALKLDKSFVIDLETREDNRVIVESTVQMAHALGLQAVAEGVESRWISEYLARVGYDRGQGWWLGRPVGAAACLEQIERREPQPPQRRAG